MELRITADLETKRTLYSERTVSETYHKQLLWKGRALFAPSCIGNHSHTNLSWTRNSVLTKLSDSKLAVGTDLVAAACDARKAFGNRASSQLTEVLKFFTKKAAELGVDIGGSFVEARWPCQEFTFGGKLSRRCVWSVLNRMHNLTN